MAWENEDDKEYLKLVIETSMNKAMKPIAEELSAHSLKLQRLDQTMYGETGNNGLRSSVIKHENEIEDLKAYKTKVIAYASVATGAITLGGALVGEKIKKMLGL